MGGDIQPSTGYMFSLEEYGTDTIYVHSLPDGALVNTLTSDVGDLQALSFADDGTLYAVTRNTDSLYTLDPATGAGTPHCRGWHATRKAEWAGVCCGDKYVVRYYVW